MTIRQPVETPHLSFPFKLNGSGTAVEVVEQDSDLELLATVELILRTPLGFRLDEPGLGVRDQLYHQGGADVGELTRAIAEWEPRVDATAEFTFDLVDVALERVRIDLRSNADG